jgi:hypothetical protein
VHVHYEADGGGKLVDRFGDAQQAAGRTPFALGNHESIKV